MKLSAILQEARGTRGMKIVDIPFDTGVEGQPDEQPPAKPSATKPTSTAVAAPTSRPVTNKAPSRSMPALSRQATPATTSQRARDVQLPDEAMGRIRDLMANVPDDGQGDAGEYRAGDEVGEVTPQTVPAVLHNAMTTTGGIAPEWHRVGDLPGRLLGPIRQLSSQLFAQYTDTPVDEIQMIANLGGGPNSAKEVDAAAKWVVDNGELSSSDTVDFEQVMPGYTADTRLYDVGDVQVLLVKDAYGKYLYAWPSDRLE